MSLSAIDLVTAAESEAKQLKTAAQAEAKKMLADAEEKGKAFVSDAVARASSELKKLKAEAQEKAAVGTEAIRRDTENKKNELRSKAEGGMDKAVEFVLERIVNG